MDTMNSDMYNLFGIHGFLIESPALLHLLAGALWYLKLHHNLPVSCSFTAK